MTHSEQARVLLEEGMSIRSLLREATHHQHDLVNRHPLLAGLLHPGYPLANYQKLLFANFSVYRVLEARINRFLSNRNCGFSYADRYKLPGLLKDLAFFQTIPLSADYAPYLTVAFPEIKTLGELIGVLYVIEGSTLGGQLISRSLIDNLNLSSEKGACFYSGYGENTAIMWRGFLSFIDTFSGDEKQCREAVDAACRTFKLFEQVFDGYINQ